MVSKKVILPDFSFMRSRFDFNHQQVETSEFIKIKKILIFDLFWPENQSKTVEKNRFFLKIPNFLRGIRWWYSFFAKIKWDAIFLGMKLKNQDHGPSTKNFVLTSNCFPVSEKNCFFFKKYVIFFVDFDGGVSFLRKPLKNPYFCRKCQKIMIFWTSIFWIFGQIWAFSLIFTKNWTHHRNLRKKWRGFKKKSIFFR